MFQFIVHVDCGCKSLHVYVSIERKDDLSIIVRNVSLILMLFVAEHSKICISKG